MTTKELLDNFFLKTPKKTFFWGLFLFETYLFLKPFKKSSFKVPIEHFDKAVHFGLFFVLTFVFLKAFENSSKAVVAVVFILYGFLIEVLQNILPFGRSFELLDLGLDTLGILTAVLIFKKEKQS
ncbi:MAG: hypothetical protein C4K58_04830 [Flavobacteriaceae bacterium]|nr:MAG: hypothetical protein C4K58_04830 [Flavobacteriaceae bacterium]